MTEDQRIPLGHILNVVSGYPLCVSGAAGVQSLIRYMIQYPVPNGSNMSRVWAIARYAILRQHGNWLQHIQLPDTKSWVQIWCWLDTMEQRWGSEHIVAPAAPEDWRAFGFPRPPAYVDSNDQPIRVAFQDPVIRYV